MCNIISELYKKWRRQSIILWSFFWMCWYHEKRHDMRRNATAAIFDLDRMCVYERETYSEASRSQTLLWFSYWLNFGSEQRYAFFFITFSQTLIANPEKIISNSGGCWLPPTAWPERTLNIEPVCKSVAHSVLPMWPENLTLDRLIF